jgi:hypothetical protein
MSHARDYFPVPGDGGRPIKGSAEEVETCLWLLAKNGGSATRAAKEMYDCLGWTHISRENIRDWATGRFKARYEQIRTEKATDIEELVASRAMEMAVAVSDVEDTALKRVQATISEANAVEASMILRNLTQSKATNVDKAGQLRGREAFKPGGANVGGLLEELAKLGLGQVVNSTAEEIVDETAAAAPRPPAPGLPPGP